MAKLRSKKTKVGAVKKKAAPKKKVVKKAIKVKVVTGYNGTTKNGKFTAVHYTNSRVTGYKTTPEIIVGRIGRVSDLKDLIPAIKVRVTRGKSVDTTVVNSGKRAVDVFKKFIGRDKIQTQEFFAVMYLKQNSQAVGVYITSMGGIAEVTVDSRLILAGALAMGATAIILCHNHPSGNTQPSSADLTITKDIKKSAAQMRISLMDHVIITKESFYSFAENGNI